MRHWLAVGACLAGIVSLVPAAALGASRPGEGSGAEPVASAGGAWAATEIATVVQAGLMGPDVASFRPDEPLTRGELHAAIVALGKTRVAPTDPARLVTMRELDAQLVAAIGGLPAARAIRLAAAAAGLAPTAMLGTETVARLLGLRINHPTGSEALERLPNEPAPRAEAAFSLARILALDPARVSDLVDRTASFSFPELEGLQREVLGRALRLVGYPYVWTGVSEKPQRLWSSTAPGGTVPAPGGFDCSGFVWRVYKLEPFATAPTLGEVLRGRTTYELSTEVKPAQRIPVGELRPGDLVFFGPSGPASKPAQIGHMGIAVGNGWFVHSSGAGVTLQPLDGWYAKTFAWGRRPIAEAGLDGT